MAVPKKGEQVPAAVTAFLGGVNTGLNPLLLRSDQLAFGLNTTVRGGFVGHRPPYREITLDFNSDAALQEAFEKGYFQGGTPYRPDSGNQSLLASISGKLFQALISGTTATIRDVSIPGDPNPALTSQSWLWQAEKWVIINNGINLPIIFDGTTSRRSYGPSVLLAEASAALPIAPPAIGAEVSLTLTDVYTGPFNVPVIMNGHLYQTKASSGTGYSVILKNKGDTPGTVIPAGTPIYVVPGLIGYVKDGFYCWSDGSLGVPSNLTADVIARGNTANLVVNNVIVPSPLADSDIPSPGYLSGNVVNPPALFQIFVAGRVLDVGSWNRDFLGDFEFQSTWPTVPSGVSLGCGTTIPAGEPVFLGSSTSPNVLVGITTADYTVPAVGSDVTVQIDRSYSGAANAAVWVNLKSYQISPSPDPAPSSTLIVVNLTDDTVPNYSYPLYIYSVPELPVGRMGAYGMGRIWMSLADGLSFIAGNIVGGEGGTPAENYRDSILKLTENDYLAGGGTFRLPGSGDVITAMIFTANLDASLGQGPLQIFTARSVFSINAPVDRTTWQDVEFPILSQSLLGAGALSQQSTIQVNSDTLFRAIDGWRSLILARRDFSEQWGNAPITREMEQVLKIEDKSLIPFVSAIQFDNRVLFGAVPLTANGGVISSKTVALNLDPVSYLNGKTPPVYDGVWTFGTLGILQFMRAVIDNVDRCFAFAYDTAALKIKIIELMPYDFENNRLDNGVTPIEGYFDTGAIFNGTPSRPLLKLENGEVYFDNILGEVDFEVLFKPDQFPCYAMWQRWSHCISPPSPGNLSNKPGFRPRVGLGEPSVTYLDLSTNRPMRYGYTFQFRMAFRGTFRFLGGKFITSVAMDQEFKPPPCVSSATEIVPCTALICEEPIILPPRFSPPIITYQNEVVTFTLDACPGGWVFIGQLAPFVESLDVSTGLLTSKAGYFTSQVSQAAANSTAAQTLEDWANSQISQGFLTCTIVS